MEYIIAAFVAIYGLIVGSFIGACIYRLPRRKGYEELHDRNFQPMDLLHPQRSICPQCKNQLLWYHNIPVFSYIFLLGKCGFCKWRIPLRYPTTELTACFLSLFCLVSYGGVGPTAFGMFVFLMAMLIVFWVDYDFYIIPNSITLGGSWIGGALVLLQEFHPFTDKPVLSFPFVQNLEQAFWGVVVGAGSLWLIAELYQRIRKRDGMGFGDIKLLFLIGLLFGPNAAVNTIFFGSLCGSLVMGTKALLRSKEALQHYIPFGPFLVIGFFLWLLGGRLVSIYI